MKAVRILVVDDEPDVGKLVERRFRRQIRGGEFEFRFAGDGQEALDTLDREEEIDLVITDINMPRMDGLTLLSRLSEGSDEIHTLVVSAYGDMENIRTAMNRGAFDFVTKPIDFEDLEKTIQKAVTSLRKFRKVNVDKASANVPRPTFPAIFLLTWLWNWSAVRISWKPRPSAATSLLSSPTLPISHPLLKI